MLMKEIGVDMSPYSIVDKYDRYRGLGAWSICLQSLLKKQAYCHHHVPVPKFADRGDSHHSSCGDCL